MGKLLIFSTSHDPSTMTVLDKLNKLGTPWVRVNFDGFSKTCDSSWLLESSAPGVISDVRSFESVCDPSEVSLVWYREPVQPPDSNYFDSSQLQFVKNETSHYWYGFFDELKHALWINPRISTTVNKLAQLSVAKKNGLAIPTTLVSNRPDDIRRFVAKHDSVIAKPVYSGSITTPASPDGTMERWMFCFTQSITTSDLCDNEALALCPVIYQERVPKRLELRVTIIGDQMYSVALDSQAIPEAALDWRTLGHEIIKRMKHEVHPLPTIVKHALMATMRELDLVFGCVDLILRPDGEYVFLEVNPYGQWNWIEHATDMDITGGIAQYMHDYVSSHPAPCGS